MKKAEIFLIPDPGAMEMLTTSQQQENSSQIQRKSQIQKKNPL